MTWRAAFISPWPGLQVHEEFDAAGFLGLAEVRLHLIGARAGARGLHAGRRGLAARERARGLLEGSPVQPRGEMNVECGWEWAQRGAEERELQKRRETRNGTCSLC